MKLCLVPKEEMTAIIEKDHPEFDNTKLLDKLGVKHYPGELDNTELLDKLGEKHYPALFGALQ